MCKLTELNIEREGLTEHMEELLLIKHCHVISKCGQLSMIRVYRRKNPMLYKELAKSSLQEGDG
jgi:hypothetical protein